MISQDKSPFKGDFEHKSEDAPQSRELPVEEVQNAINWLEERHEIKLPLDFRYIDRITRGCCVRSKDLPSKMSPEEIDELATKRNSTQMVNRPNVFELRGIHPVRFAVFMPRSQMTNHMDAYATLWEELGHATGWVLGIYDPILNESLVLSYRFRGVLKGVKEERFLLDEAASKIELEVRSVGADAAVMSRLKSMGFGASHQNRLSHYDDSLFAIKEYNPKLVFRNRSPDELIAELDKSICYTLECAKKRKFKFEKHLVLGLVGAILVLVAASILNHFYGA